MAMAEMELFSAEQVLLASALLEALAAFGLEASQGLMDSMQSSNENYNLFETLTREVPLTTLMVRNIPKKLTQKQFMSEADFAVFLNYIDFLYLPTDISSGRNLGYAFINFQSPELASLFKDSFHKQHIFPGNKTALTVSYALIQGLSANVDNIKSNASVHRIRNPDYLPLIRCGGPAHSDLLAWHRC